jgi:hypothetical protein
VSTEFEGDIRAGHVLDLGNAVLAFEAATKLELNFASFGRCDVSAMQMQGFHTRGKIRTLRNDPS